MWKKTKVMIVSWQQSPSSKTAGECGIFKKFLCSDNEWCKMYTWN